MMNYNSMAKSIYANNVKVGWWDNKDSIDPLEKLQLVSTEIAEATEGERKDIMDDHLPHRKMGEVELADAMIRLLDFGGAYECNYIKAGNSLNSASAFLRHSISISGKHFAINVGLVDFANSFMFSSSNVQTNHQYSVCVNIIKDVSDSLGYDIFGAMEDKISYNAIRADHKRENRAKKDGKKF
tara:strand:+ start:12909 stop:13460 length:552 start_codon:yes stop_codon:yes gene_type:complete